MDNAKVNWLSIINVVNTRCIRTFCRHDVYYSQPITAHDLPLVGQQKTNKFVNGRPTLLPTFCVGQLFEHTTDFCLPTLLANICWSCVCDFSDCLSVYQWLWSTPSLWKVVTSPWCRGEKWQQHELDLLTFHFAVMCNCRHHTHWLAVANAHSIFHVCVLRYECQQC